MLTEALVPALRARLAGGLCALGCVPAVAAAQDVGSGADLLDISRRAAVVDQVLDDHLDLMRRGRVFSTSPRLRMAANLSFYGVSKLALTTPEDGTFPAELSRTYTGFLVEWLERPSPEGELGAPAKRPKSSSRGTLAAAHNALSILMPMSSALSPLRKLSRRRLMELV
jgi:hypothetical protein